MDLHSAMETFAEAWVAANTQTPLTEGADSHVPIIQSNHDVLSADKTFTNLSSNHHRSHAVPDEAMKDPKNSTPVSKSIPVHCLIEQVIQNDHQANDSHNSSTSVSPIEIDTFAIISTATLFRDIVKTALLKLEYSTEEAGGAQGSIQIQNWKPLSFDSVTNDPEATVGDIIGHLTSVATLRIMTYRTKPLATSCSSSALEVKDKLLQILLAQSQGLLIGEGCPIDQQLLYAISNGCLNRDIPQEIQANFQNWYQQQIYKIQQQFICAAISKAQDNVVSTDGCGSSEETSGQEGNPIRIRLRTSFDTELELPLLNKWFDENPHPNRYQIQQYVHKLNSLDSRKDRKPLDVNNVVYWFKNARAAHKRAEQRAANLKKDSQDFNNNTNIHRLKKYADYIKKVHLHHLGQKDCESDEENAIDVTKENHRSIKPEKASNLPEDHHQPVSDPKHAFTYPSPLKSSLFKTNSLGISQSFNKIEELNDASMSLFDLGHRKRNRTFIDPISEVPLLEQWFCINSHPSFESILRYTSELNRKPYRIKFPKLEPKNVQFWFKNRRAKSKRLKVAPET